MQVSHGPTFVKILAHGRSGRAFINGDNFYDGTALPKPDKKIGNFIDRGAVVLRPPSDHGDHGATHDGHRSRPHYR
jgi:hypothetical protein